MCVAGFVCEELLMSQAFPFTMPVAELEYIIPYVNTDGVMLAEIMGLPRQSFP